MTNEEINEAVATKIMGYPKPSGKIVELYSPATNIAQAFEMEEKIKTDGNELRYSRLLIMCLSEIAPIENIIWEAAHASPLARCRAALKVYGVGG